MYPGSEFHFILFDLLWVMHGNSLTIHPTPQIMAPSDFRIFLYASKNLWVVKNMEHEEVKEAGYLSTRKEITKTSNPICNKIA